MALERQDAVDSLDVERVRKDFPIFEQTFNGKPLAYLNSAATSQKPRQVLDAMQTFYETTNANVARGVYAIAEEATNEMEAARPSMGVLLSTHYQRILQALQPDVVHILVDGRIVETGGPELSRQLEREGFAAWQPSPAASGAT